MQASRSASRYGHAPSRWPFGAAPPLPTRASSFDAAPALAVGAGPGPLSRPAGAGQAGLSGPGFEVRAVVIGQRGTVPFGEPRSAAIASAAGRAGANEQASPTGTVQAASHSSDDHMPVLRPNFFSALTASGPPPYTPKAPVVVPHEDAHGLREPRLAGRQRLREPADDLAVHVLVGDHHVVDPDDTGGFPMSGRHRNAPAICGDPDAIGKGKDHALIAPDHLPMQTFKPRSRPACSICRRVRYVGECAPDRNARRKGSRPECNGTSQPAANASPTVVRQRRRC